MIMMNLNRSSISVGETRLTVQNQYENQIVTDVPVAVLNNLIALTGPAVCQIVTKEGTKGTGAIYNLDVGTEQTTLFATVKHVLSETAARNGTTELNFTEVEAMKNIILKKEWIAYFWENEELDATVIEFTASAIAELKANSAKSLRIYANQVKTDKSGQQLDFNNEPLKLAIVKYSNHNHKTYFSFAPNSAISIDNAFEIYRNRIETTQYSSGSPVLNLEGEALAMQQGAQMKKSDFPNNYTGEIRGVLWQAILEEFLADRTNYKMRHWYVLI